MKAYSSSNFLSSIVLKHMQALFNKQIINYRDKIQYTLFWSVHLHQTGHHVACVLPRLVADVGHHLDDLAWCVTSHVSLGLQDHCARFYHHVSEMLCYC